MRQRSLTKTTSRTSTVWKARRFRRVRFRSALAEADLARRKTITGVAGGAVVDVLAARSRLIGQ
jgi:hypothetical protein